LGSAQQGRAFIEQSSKQRTRTVGNKLRSGSVGSRDQRGGAKRGGLGAVVPSGWSACWLGLYGDPSPQNHAIVPDEERG
jgi:hypothetical protein